MKKEQNSEDKIVYQFQRIFELIFQKQSEIGFYLVCTSRKKFGVERTSLIFDFIYQFSNNSSVEKKKNSIKFE